jgi:hypothetical protein
MRYHLDILKDIQGFLSQNNFDTELASLNENVLASATGGELCMLVGSWLLGSNVKNLKAIPKMNILISEFIDYCHVNGLHPVPS